MPLKKQYPWNVLVFPASSEIGLEIHRSLRDCKEVVLHGAGYADLNEGMFHFKRFHPLPSIYDTDCLAALQKLVEREKIDAIFPAHDDVILWLAEHAEKLQAAVITPPLAACRISRSKRETYKLFAEDFPVPKLWEPKADIKFPVFVKPEKGQGSRRARKIENRAALEVALAAEPDLIVMENLQGREYTVDCFSRQGEVLFAEARERLRTKSGIATLCRPVSLPYVKDWARIISSKLKLRGAWFFQLKELSAGKPKLLEVAPRLAGSMALSRVTGPNFALLSLYEAAGHELKIEAFASGLTMARSFDISFIYDQPIGAVYMDFDDTLVVHGRVNTRMAALVFQCHNRGIPVHLLTHHPGNLDAALKKFRLAGLFTSIIHVPDPKKQKANFINGENAVFIDDSFRERAEAAKVKGVRCFDAAGAVCLIDERE